MTPNQFKILQLVQQGRNDFELLSGLVDLSEFDALVTGGFLVIDESKQAGIMRPTPAYRLTSVGELAITPMRK
jgi:hypothetical protein